MTGPADAEIRVLLVDDQELARSGLRLILRPNDGFVIAGECGDGAEVPAALAATEVDVVVMDLRMKNVGGIEATRRLRQSGDHPPVLALTTFDDDELLAGALRAGAVGYVLKDSSAEDLIRAVRAVAAGDAWLDAAVTARVLTTYRQAAPDRAAGPPPGLLTAREQDVLRAVGRGLTDAEIAASLVISEVTVRSDLGRIFAKLGLRDRTAAVIYAFDHGIVNPGEVGRDHAPRPIVRDRPTVRAGSVSAPPLRFSALGPLRAWRGVAQLDLGPVRQQALLAALVLRSDQTVTDAELLDGVWGLEPPGTGVNVLRTYVLRLRTCLRAAGESTKESVIRRSRTGYSFVGHAVRMDVTRLREITAEAGAAEEAGELAMAVDACTDALDLFHGEPLAGLPGPFAAGERLRLVERKVKLSQQKAELQLRLGRYVETADELSAVLAVNPHREPLAALLMRALYARGLRAEALAVYRRIHDQLVRDFEVEPGEELRRTRAAVLRRDDGYLGFA
ncbi:Protein-glutamate methylesterase/protein-glutamine glutaminase [Kutzneria sp. CA-103260]|nr:Protein-glutamate methylesterase/protein-glutamine glutaminase [Kutzneria sp. CA-103260]